MSESKTSVRRIDATEKQRQALTLRRAGASYESIAEKLGYKSPSGAHKAIISALQKTLKEPAEELRTLELQRLDTAQLAIASDVQRGDLYAIDRWIKLINQRCAILGLNAPVEIKVRELVQNQLDAEFNLFFSAIQSDEILSPEAKLRVLAIAQNLGDRAAVAVCN